MIGQWPSFLLCTLACPIEILRGTNTMIFGLLDAFSRVFIDYKYMDAHTITSFAKTATGIKINRFPTHFYVRHPHRAIIWVNSLKRGNARFFQNNQIWRPRTKPCTVNVIHQLMDRKSSVDRFYFWLPWRVAVDDNRGKLT